MMKQIGLYVHIPFCKQKCAYCDFSSYAGRECDMERYIHHLIDEISEKASKEYQIDTLFIGGGTPSLLPPDLMEKLLSALHSSFFFSPNAECTCECNPGTVTKDFLTILKQNGINRLSFGAQASQPGLLSLLGRIHTWAQVKESVDMAHQAGFDNINLDLMLGLPEQTVEDLSETLDSALALSPFHLSCYGLIVEEGTKMYAMVESGKWHLPNEDTEREMYELCRKRLTDYGMIQYEISNFSLPGHTCRHNTDCWSRKEYLGFGCAACSFLDEKRYQNPSNLDDYLSGKAPEIIPISREDARFESIMLGLRMMKGVSLSQFQAMHGVDLMDIYGDRLQKSFSLGLVVLQDGYLRLTRKGMDVQNTVLVELL